MILLFGRISLDAINETLTTVNAESYCLVLFSVKTGIEKIEMASMEQCEENGEKFKTMKAYAPHKHYICIKGK